MGPAAHVDAEIRIKEEFGGTVYSMVLLRHCCMVSLLVLQSQLSKSAAAYMRLLDKGVWHIS